MAVKRKTTKAPKVSSGLSQAELKSRIMTEIMRDMIATPSASAAGYDRETGGHDRYGKAGRSGADALINPADRFGTTARGRGGRGGGG